MVSKKAVIPVIFAAVGLVFTIWGMFGQSRVMLYTGVGLWVASVVSGQLVKKKSKTSEESHS